jgi:SAM-dependent methyltransferase
MSDDDGVHYREGAFYDAAEWYDVEFGAYVGERTFYERLVQWHQRPGGVVVELGAGTGRLTLPIARTGVSVHAVEPADSMRLRLVDKVARGGVPGVVVEKARAHDFEGPPHARTDVVMFAFNGVLHLDSRAQLHASFAHIHEKLDDDGRFAFDTTGPYWDRMRSHTTSWTMFNELVHPTTGKRIAVHDRHTYDPRTRAAEIDVRFHEVGASHGVQLRLQQTAWTWQELLGALDATGFVVDQIFGDVDFKSFHEGSPRMLVSARKRAPSPGP